MSKESCGMLLLVLGVLAFLVWIVAGWRLLYPAILFGSRHSASSEERRKLVAEVRASGESLATTSCPGQVDGYVLHGPLLTVDVRPLGIIVTPLFGSSAVLANQITQLSFESGIFMGRLRITHASPAIFSPIILYGEKEDSEFARALRSIVPTASDDASARRQ
jgi:hypothetical protein